jgi:hypothetical protein
VLPFGLRNDNETIKHAISYAYFKGIIMLAAASPYGLWMTAFPAHLNEVISIHSSDGFGSISRFNPPYSGRGGSVFMTLGESVDIPFLGARKSGTAIAAVIAAGIAGLILDFGAQRMESLSVFRKMCCPTGMRALFSLEGAITGGDFVYLRPWFFLNSTKDARAILSDIGNQLRNF